MIITIIYAIIIHGKFLAIGGDSLSNERVRFFDSNDMMYGYKLDKIATMSVPNYSEIDINDAIEFYEIKRYFDNGVRSREWNDEEYEKYRNKADKLYTLTLRLFNCLCDNNIVDEYNKNYAVYIRNRFKAGAKHVIVMNYRKDWDNIEVFEPNEGEQYVPETTQLRCFEPGLDEEEYGKNR